MAQGLINNGVSITKDFSPNEYELLKDYTVLDSAITSYTFSGLKLNADEEIVLISSFISAIGTDLRLYANGNLTNTNYWYQYILAIGTAVQGTRANLPNFSFATTGTNTFSYARIKLTNNGHFTWQSENSWGFGSALNILNYNGSSTFTTSQINSLTILSDVASAIGIGSRFQLYKVKGQVQQTWATT